MTQPVDKQADERRILLGQITAAHGIRGDVIVRTYTGDPVDIASYGPLTDKAGGRPLSLSILRVSDKGVVVRVKGVTDRNGAEALRGRELYVARSKLPKANEAEYYHADLIGLRAMLEDGREFGRVIAVQNFGAGDLLEIKLSDGGDVEFIPFTNACVPEVDLGAGTLVVVPPVMTGDEGGGEEEGGEEDVTEDEAEPK